MDGRARGAVTETGDYAAQLEQLRKTEPDPERRYEALVCEDLRAACDLLLPAFVNSGGDDGYVSWEVAPRFAHDADLTAAEARRLHGLVGRDNLLIKVPGTEAGLRAFERLTAFERIDEGTAARCAIAPPRWHNLLGRGIRHVLMAHNHPSADPRPSRADIDCTREAAAFLAVLDVDLVEVTADRLALLLRERGEERVGLQFVILHGGLLAYGGGPIIRRAPSERARAGASPAERPRRRASGRATGTRRAGGYGAVSARGSCTLLSS